MSVAFDNIGAWVLSPYCFCQNNDWLSVDKLHYIDDPDRNVGVGADATSGLSKNDTALLAALIMALALFLFLLYLLTCCLCPNGLCCGNKGMCCSKESKSGTRKQKFGQKTSKVNLTAVDMKIPRPWTTDSSIRMSEGEVIKAKNATEHSKANFDQHNGKRGDGYLNEAYSEDEGWFSTSELDSLYGEKDRKASFANYWMKTGKRKGNREEMISMDKSYANRNNFGNSSLRSRCYSTADIEKLMTPKSSQEVSWSGRDVAGDSRCNQQSQHVSYAVTAPRSPENSTLVVADSGKSSSMNAVSEISFESKNPTTNQIENQGTLRPGNYFEMLKTNGSSTRSADSLSFTNGGSTLYPEPSLITEVSSTYKRQVIEETETVLI
ncbi:hypothetical protein Btru_044239 [Bulinus truncatus]|nr:hypothetical protein Btru_044239 [Bulinus truncatus]